MQIQIKLTVPVRNIKLSDTQVRVLNRKTANVFENTAIYRSRPLKEGGYKGNNYKRKTSYNTKSTGNTYVKDAGK